MKIISKYKDYYDYLAGIYGVDPKLILDRRKGTKNKLISPAPFKIAVCNHMISGFFDGKRAYCGKNLLKIGEAVDKNALTKYGFEKIKFIRIKISLPYMHETFNINPKIEKTDLNIKKDCPILLIDNTGVFYKYPHLGSFDIPNIFDAKEMFLMLSDWLSKRITKKEHIKDNRTDIMKLQDKGFDKRCSFRPKIKNC